MELADELYVSDNITDLETVVYSLKKNIPMPRLYCLLFRTLKNRYEIISSWQLCKGNFPLSDGVVIGVANGKQEAYSLLSFLLEEAMQNKKDILNPQTWIARNTNESTL